MIVSVGVVVGEVVISFLLDEQPVKISVDKNNKIIGVCAGLKKSDDVIKFNTFYVDKSFRSEGIGARLYEEFMNYAKEYKYKTIILGTCERLNLAIRFYEKRGFELYKTDGEDRYYKKDIMQIIADYTP